MRTFRENVAFAIPRPREPPPPGLSAGMDETLLATLRLHADRVELAADALDRALGEACREIERVLRLFGLGQLKLTAPVPYVGPEGDYHARLEAVQAEAEGGLVFVDDCGESVDAQSVGSEALRSALGQIDLRAAVAAVA